MTHFVQATYDEAYIPSEDDPKVLYEPTRLQKLDRAEIMNKITAALDVQFMYAPSLNDYFLVSNYRYIRGYATHDSIVLLDAPNIHGDGELIAKLFLDDHENSIVGAVQEVFQRLQWNTQNYIEFDPSMKGWIKKDDGTWTNERYPSYPEPKVDSFSQFILAMKHGLPPIPKINDDLEVVYRKQTNSVVILMNGSETPLSLEELHAFKVQICEAENKVREENRSLLIHLDQIKMVERTNKGR